MRCVFPSPQWYAFISKVQLKCAPLLTKFIQKVWGNSATENTEIIREVTLWFSWWDSNQKMIKVIILAGIMNSGCNKSCAKEHTKHMTTIYFVKQQQMVNMNHQV